MTYPNDRKLAHNFWLSEFAVSASKPHLVQPVPAEYEPSVHALALHALQPIRDFLGQPLRITSGYRSDALNNAVGGSATSQHRYGQAADCTCSDTFALFLSLVDGSVPGWFGQVIYYPAQHFIHVAIPSRRYPVPTFFVSQHSKAYTQVFTRQDVLNLGV